MSSNNVARLNAPLVVCWLAPAVIVVAVMSFHVEVANTLLILLGCFGTVSFLIWILFAFEGNGPSFWDKLAIYAIGGDKSPRNAGEEMTLTSEEDWERIRKEFKSNLTDTASTLKMLSMFKKRMQKNNAFTLDCAKHGLLKYAIMSIANAGVDDVRIPIALDVINSMLAASNAKEFLATNSDMNSVRENVDNFLQTANFIYTNNIEVKTDEETETSEETALLYPTNQQKKQIKTSVTFQNVGYKMVMTIGLLCADCKEAQSRLGDKGAVQMLVKLLQQQVLSVVFSKWCYWSLIQLSENHPPNKRAFVIAGGIPSLIEALKAHPKSLEVYQQGLILLYYILSPDSQTKLNLPEVRQSALANGIVDVLHKAQRHFVDENSESIRVTAASILDILIADWS